MGLVGPPQPTLSQSGGTKTKSFKAIVLLGVCHLPRQVFDIILVRNNRKLACKEASFSYSCIASKLVLLICIINNSNILIKCLHSQPLSSGLTG